MADLGRNKHMVHKQVRDTIFVYLKPARMGKRRGAYRVFVGKPEEMKHLEDLDVHGRILVKWVFEKFDVGLLLRGFSYFKSEAYARLSIFDVSATQEHIAKRFVRTGITSLEGIETTPLRASCQERPLVLWYPQIRRRVRSIPSLVPIPSQMNPIHDCKVDIIIPPSSSKFF